MSRGRGLRLGVTGLSRAGKTVFITALAQQLTTLANVAAEGRKNPLPVFRLAAEGRLISGRLEPQPDDNVARFAFEDHVAALTGPDRHWPQSTRQISELRLRLDFEQRTGFRHGPSSFVIDIVDYPGEWLLDLPLLEKSYAEWSRETYQASAGAARAPLAAEWRGFCVGLDPAAPADEAVARRATELFTAYLKAARAETYALSTLPPGRFLMPGDLEGSPALTFAPLPLPEDHSIASGTLAAMMERRYEAYKSHIVKPFFRDHFARLDRQIVLVDALAALNSGPAALRDLQHALDEVLAAFRVGRRNTLTRLFRPKIDKILVAATKADHLHHLSHDRLEAILRQVTARAIARADFSGAKVDVIALAAMRATREAAVRRGRETLDAIVGTPMAGEKIDGEVFDGQTEAAIFPGQLPADPREAFRGDGIAVPEAEADVRFLRFRPPVPTFGADGEPLPAPHIRLDRACQFLFGDRLS
ncbi:YcjX family protein [Rhodoblastus acidophilus]|uniref:YcjX family protein n=2 Tax=Candidatus Rhodoblastus alkanivorans TaxID=2954117 RepID=A0ABS9Z9A7_9HYPH|nr:YcjX family protein [Candidatus Rhodoblastus alkanivorans]MCI4677896.1 YcjX family protein [Candidatus Rhodoblastus alkanivorans]MCI4683792.1 YcjX family protein [Candidatus Rhodoblastus alkanivorans]MDI4641110.1 YcjX family protein [Rhodoblastus acidophilus]